MTELIEFDTERLRLRQWIESDREPFARLCSDPRVMEFYPNILDRTASDAMVDRLEALISDRGWGLWAVELKAEQQYHRLRRFARSQLRFTLLSVCRNRLAISIAILGQRLRN